MALLGTLTPNLMVKGRRPTSFTVFLYVSNVECGWKGGGVYRSLVRESETPCMLVLNLAGLPFNPFDVRERKKLAMQKGVQLYSGP